GQTERRRRYRGPPRGGGSPGGRARGYRRVERVSVAPAGTGIDSRLEKIVTRFTLQAIDDLLDVLRAIFRRYQEGIRRVDHHQALDADERHELAGRPDVIPVRVLGDLFVACPVVRLLDKLREARPRSDVLPRDVGRYDRDVLRLLRDPVIDGRPV